MCRVCLSDKPTTPCEDCFQGRVVPEALDIGNCGTCGQERALESRFRHPANLNSRCKQCCESSGSFMCLHCNTTVGMRHESFRFDPYARPGKFPFCDKCLSDAEMAYHTGRRMPLSRSEPMIYRALSEGQFNPYRPMVDSRSRESLFPVSDSGFGGSRTNLRMSFSDYLHERQREVHDSQVHGFRPQTFEDFISADGFVENHSPDPPESRNTYEETEVTELDLPYGLVELRGLDELEERSAEVSSEVQKRLSELERKIKEVDELKKELEGMRGHISDLRFRGGRR